MLNNIPENVKSVIFSAAPLLISLFLFLLVGNFGIGKITEVRAQIDDATSLQNVMTQKLNILQSVSQTLGSSPDVASAALPSDDSALLAISQLKNLAASSSLALSNIKASPTTADPSGGQRIDITFEATGSRDQVVNFIKGISLFAPITLVNTIKMNESGGSTKATVSVQSFWSPLPTTLPAVTDAINDLTQQEKDTLANIATLTQPVFLVLPSPAPAGRADPFSP